ncbi:MAG: response regulator transcription factor [Ignavibacteriaceae bacterium]|nr:response regulator transcription factor [Ignavibacteriaceae bacterium]
MKILILEDEKEISESIAAFLKKEGYVCDFAEKLTKASQLVNLFEYDCALIDLMLPDGSGLDLINLIKQKQPKCGVVVISAKNSLDDKVSGLNLGADDYLTKPFHLVELNARIKSLLRRRNFDGNNVIEFEDIKIELEKRKVSIKNKVIELTRREYDLLLFFMSNKERVLTKEAITEHIWGDNSNAFDNLDFVYTHIKNLRKKLSESGAVDNIQSVYGVGYKFAAK